MSQLRAKLAAAAEENGAEAEAREAAAADAAADRAALQRAPTVGVFLSFLCVFLFVICDVVNICIDISIYTLAWKGTGAASADNVADTDCCPLTI